MKRCEIALLALAAATGLGPALLGCASSPAAAGRSAAGPPPESAIDYYPLALGWRWAYQLEKGGERMLAMYGVLERIEDTAVVQAGDERIAYAILPEGIARRDGLRVGDFVLKNPIRAGASWPIEGGQARVTAVGLTVSTPAGKFENAATIEETRTNPERVVRTTYAAGVGPVQVEMLVHDAAAGVLEVTLRASLVGVTRPGEDPLGAPPSGAGTGGQPPPRPRQ